MATTTIAIYRPQAGGTVTFLADYNAQNGRVRSLICENTTARAAYGQVRNPDTGEVYGQIFPPNETLERVVPAGVIRIRLVQLGEGEIDLEVEHADGTWALLDASTHYPAD